MKPTRKGSARAAASTQEKSSTTRRLAIYMFFDPAGVVSDYIPYKLEKLRDHVETILVVCNGTLTPEGREKLERVADVVHVRENKGFDVWAYREGLLGLVGWEKLASYDEVLFINYTFYAPIFPFSEMFGKMEQQDVDFWGITAFRGPVPNFFTGEGVIPFHIQSHFIAVRRRMFRSQAFVDYWEKMPPINSYVDSVLKHESKFTEHFAAKGYRFGVYCDPDKYPVVHPTFDIADVLLEDRSPILKRRTLFHDPHYLEASCVDTARALEVIRTKSDYDLRLIWQDIGRSAKPRDLYTNATLFEVPSDRAEPPRLRKGMRVAVLAHCYYPEMLDEMLGYASNVPVPFDLYVTTSGEARKQQIEAMLAERKPALLASSEVRAVENRGRDMAALFIGLRDVVLEGKYDYLCRIHSKVTPQNAFQLARHFKEHLFENLLGSRAYVGNLLALFEREPNLGVILPPVVHIGYPTLGHGWFSNRPGAEEWAKKLGIRVPFDDFTPLAVYGGMWWFRADALRPLFEYKFRYTQFPPEPEYRDGDLPHILERLIVYTAHHGGYYAKCVLTPGNAAKNYVKLEYKLQALIGQMTQAQNAAAATPTFPKQQLKQYVAHRLLAKPTTFKLVRSAFRATRKTYRMAMKVRRRGEP